MPAFFSTALFLVFPVVMAVAAVSDLTTFTIPNRLSGVLVAGFLVAALAIGMPLQALGLHVLAGAAVLVAGFAMFSFGWIGGGDAKIAAAAALWIGFGQLLPFLVYASMLGGVLTILIMHFRSSMLPAGALSQGWIFRLHDKASGVPYGIAIAAGAMLVFPDTPFLALAAG